MSRVTILLPFRNATDTLDAAIASIASQTFKDWTLLLIANQATTEELVIAEQWVERDARIALLAEPRIGIAHALNTGLASANGEFIARMDADDISHPERLARQVAYLDTNMETGVLGTCTRFETSVQKSSGMAWFVAWQNGIITPHEHYVKRFVDAPLAHPTVMFRQELADRFGGYDTGPLPEDHELWLRWMHHGVRFAKLPAELLTWRDHPDRLSRNHPNYSIDAFFSTKAQWIAKWYARKFPGDHPVIIAGTSGICRDRAQLLEDHGMHITGFTDVKKREVPGYTFIPHDALPGPGEALVISFISQRGTGERIAAYLTSRGSVEGRDFVLAA